ncbi:hypothetical protein PRK78_000484 [Emydomyces testavorans]|uniref:Uncharacterized protein n=1 Tax=Emydomyces testavorans TaxID=2070801 RepID=A0AAF0DBV0_9EURO|nr:hypothetical protein PRK78_000484 [Emydomyces testavorans]
MDSLEETGDNSAGILLSYLSGSWLVSLFETLARADSLVEEEPWYNKEDARLSLTSDAADPTANSEEQVLPGCLKRKMPQKPTGWKVESWLVEQDAHQHQVAKRRPSLARNAMVDAFEDEINSDTDHQTNSSFVDSEDDLAFSETVSLDTQTNTDYETDEGLESLKSFHNSADGMSETDSEDSGSIFSKAVSLDSDSSIMPAKKINVIDANTDVEDTFDLFDPSNLIRDDESTVTDDGCFVGDQTKGSFLWRHVQFYIVCGEAPGQPNMLLAKVTLIHTKDEDKKLWIKIFVTVHNCEPIFDLLGNLVIMALEDEVFAAKFKCLENIYWQPILPHQCGMAVKIKADKLDMPVFWEPEQTANGLHTSKTKSLKGST